MKAIIAALLILALVLTGCSTETQAKNVAANLDKSNDLLSKCETAGGQCLPNCEVEYKTEYSHYLCVDESNKRTGQKCCF